MRSTPKPKNRTWLIVVGIIAVLLLGFYLYKSTFFESHFLPRTSVNKIDVGGLTADKANDKLLNAFNSEDFELTVDGQNWKSISKKDLGVKTEFLTDLQDDLKKQNAWLWPLAYIKKWQNFELNNTSLDDDSLKKYLETLKPELENFNTTLEPTVNATIQKTENGFEIIPEKIGTVIDIQRVLDTLGSNIKDGHKSLELTDSIQQPTLLADSPEITQDLEKIKKITDADYTYNINGQAVPIPKENIISWVSFDGNTKSITVDREAVANYVAQLGATYNTSTNPTTFNSTLRGQVSVPSGTYSWTIQKDSETEQLVNDLLAGNGMNRSPIAEGSASPQYNLVSGTYIEVDLANQHMWYYKDGALQLETDIVSGKPSTPTPTGVFYVWNRQRNATLVGEDYRTPVSYWMPIDWNGVGIHDSNWQPAYGGALWQTVGSHGCINTPPAVAGQLFEAVTTGTPVLVF